MQEIMKLQRSLTFWIFKRCFITHMSDLKLHCLLIFNIRSNKNDSLKILTFPSLFYKDIIPFLLYSIQYRINETVEQDTRLLDEGRKASNNNIQSRPHSPHFIVRATQKSLSFQYHFLKCPILKIKKLKSGNVRAQSMAKNSFEIISRCQNVQIH